MSDLGLGQEEVPLALISHGKVTSYILGDKKKLYHQSLGLAELFGAGMSKDHIMLMTCPMPAWDGTWERGVKGSWVASCGRPW